METLFTYFSSIQNVNRGEPLYGRTHTVCSSTIPHSVKSPEIGRGSEEKKGPTWASGQPTEFNLKTCR